MSHASLGLAPYPTVSPRQTKRSAPPRSAAATHAVSASMFACTSVRMAVRIAAGTVSTPRSRAVQDTEERALLATGGGRRAPPSTEERALPVTDGGGRAAASTGERALPATGGGRRAAAFTEERALPAT